MSSYEQRGPRSEGLAAFAAPFRQSDLPRRSSVRSKPFALGISASSIAAGVGTRSERTAPLTGDEQGCSPRPVGSGQSTESADRTAPNDLPMNRARARRVSHLENDTKQAGALRLRRSYT